MIDTHCHLDMLISRQKAFPLPKDIYALNTHMTRAKRAGVHRTISIAIDVPSSRYLAACQPHVAGMFHSVGIHPCDCTASWRNDVYQLATHIATTSAYPVAIGETGLDLHHETTHLQRQTDCFKAHIDLALTYKLPLVIHSRKALDETLAVLDDYKNEPLSGVIHCFQGTYEHVEDIIDRGFYLGIGGPITYPKNTILRSCITPRTLESCILETDAPFLPPQSHRGKKNHPQHVATIADTLADLLAYTTDDVDIITTRNACRLFQLPPIS